MPCYVGGDRTWFCTGECTPMRFLLCLPAVLVLALPAAIIAQTSVPPNMAAPFKDTSTLKPPAGSRVAVIEYEDLQCPGCARAYPMVHAAIAQYHIPLEEYDCQVPSHPWSHEAAIFSHYLHEKVSPALSDEYRRQLFAAQRSIASRDDLHQFIQNFMKAHGKPVPAVVDPIGAYDREVKASTAQALQLGVVETPTIVVVTADHWIQVKDPTQIDKAIQQAQSEAPKASGRTSGR